MMWFLKQKWLSFVINPNGIGAELVGNPVPFSALEVGDMVHASESPTHQAKQYAHFFSLCKSY